MTLRICAAPSPPALTHDVLVVSGGVSRHSRSRADDPAGTWRRASVSQGDLKPGKPNMVPACGAVTATLNTRLWPARQSGQRAGLLRAVCSAQPFKSCEASTKWSAPNFQGQKNWRGRPFSSAAERPTYWPAALTENASNTRSLERLRRSANAADANCLGVLAGATAVFRTASKSRRCYSPILLTDALPWPDGAPIPVASSAVRRSEFARLEGRVDEGSFGGIAEFTGLSAVTARSWALGVWLRSAGNGRGAARTATSV